MPLIPFAFSKKLQKLVDINEVQSGLACECICESCKMEVQARKGDHNEHHFSHHEKAKTDCSYSYWVSIRSMARQLLKEADFLAVENQSIFNLHNLSPFSKASSVLKIFNAKRISTDSFEMMLDTSVGIVYIIFLTPEDNHKDQYVSYDQTEKLILEIDLNNILFMTKTDSTKNHLYELIVNNSKTKTWMNTFQLFVREKEKSLPTFAKKIEKALPNYTYPKKSIKTRSTVTQIKNHNVLKDRSLYVENKEILNIFGLEEKELYRNQIKTINTMIGFYNHCFRYDRSSESTEKFTVIDRGQNLELISYKNFFYCVADLQTIKLIYQVKNKTDIYEIAQTDNFNKISVVIDLALKEAEELF